MRILFISNNYPSTSRPANGTFVQQFVWAMARQGNECVVIRPTSFWEKRYGQLSPIFEEEEAGNGAIVKVHRPRYLSFSSKNLKVTHTGQWTQWAFNMAALKTARKIKPKPDIVYGHFLYAGGYAAVKVGESLAIPSVIGVGESDTWTITTFGKKKANKHFSTNKIFFLPNSLKNLTMIMNVLNIREGQTRVEPNGIDLSLFYPRDQYAMRKKFNLSHSDFIIAFVGANEERKGPKRVLRAVEGIPDIHCIFAGNGTEEIVSDQLLLRGPLHHIDIPFFLSSADIFVLPTLSEGSCNAVLEAMACGLPIVTAKGKHMDDIVDDNVAIRVDPMDVEEIRSAILKLKNDPKLRQKMSQACLDKAKDFDINERAGRIAEWMSSLCQKYHDE